MITESKTTHHELESSVTGDHLAAYVINKLRDPGVAEIHLLENLGSNAGNDAQSWKYITNRLAVHNYLSNNNLNTDDENSLAVNLLQKHGITRANYIEFFDNPLSASQLISAYEVTQDIKSAADTENHKAA